MDDVTAEAYEQALDENLASVLSRFKSKTYRAPPVRRVHIPKGDGSKTRPIGIPIVFTDEDDARRVMNVLSKRFGKYGLTLHPEKTRLVPFHRPGGGDDDDGPGAFDFLGFTHFWGKSRWKNWVVQRKTASSRMRRVLKATAAWCRAHRHDPVREQHRSLSRELVGHYQYFGITGNWSGLNIVRRRVQEIWRKWLNRRSQRRRMTWERFVELIARMPLPPPKVVHSAYRHVAKP